MHAELQHSPADLCFLSRDVTLHSNSLVHASARHCLIHLWQTASQSLSDTNLIAAMELTNDERTSCLCHVDEKVYWHGQKLLRLIFPRKAHWLFEGYHN